MEHLHQVYLDSYYKHRLTEAGPPHEAVLAEACSLGGDGRSQRKTVAPKAKLSKFWFCAGSLSKANQVAKPDLNEVGGTAKSQGERCVYKEG